ncbi:hypothetical protein DM860_003753 [Cuscuta australis]|uniref:Uncharacterized protein n=1 Tax=Cuscuta australis TaxID=267555 RepID=A0A328DHL4_9ASTE|nr:hypothetical protein DM860_003753 [Cuscuta australis]
MAEWSKAPDSSSGLRKRAWVRTPLLTFSYVFLFCKTYIGINFLVTPYLKKVFVVETA